MNLKDLQKKVSDYSTDCFDALVESKNTSFMSGGSIAYSTKNNLFGSVHQVGKLNDYSSRQICSRLDGPPANWIFDQKHCPDQIATNLLNQLIAERDPMEWMIRSKGETVRAVLSDQYTPFDNLPMVDLVCKAVETMGIEPEVARVYTGDELSAYVLFPQATVEHDPRDNGKGGNLHPAIHISNSEIGTRKAKITSAVFTGFCQNGMIYGWNWNETMEVRHRFISTEVMGVLVANAIAEGLNLSETAAKKFVQSQEIHVPKPDLSFIVQG